MMKLEIINMKNRMARKFVEIASRIRNVGSFRKSIVIGYPYFCCIRLTSKQEEIFNKIYKPNKKQQNSANGWFGVTSNKQNQEARRLALLFAAEIAKDEGL